MASIVEVFFSRYCLDSTLKYPPIGSFQILNLLKPNDTYIYVVPQR